MALEQARPVPLIWVWYQRIKGQAELIIRILAPTAVRIRLPSRLKARLVAWAPDFVPRRHLVFNKNLNNRTKIPILKGNFCFWLLHKR
jgi:hypothetical protein